MRITEHLEGKALDGLGAVLARHLHGDLVVVVEINPAAALRLVLRREEVLLEALVRAHIPIKPELVLAAAAAAAAEVAASPNVAAGPARVLLELRRLAALLVALEEGAAAAAASLGRPVVLLLLLLLGLAAARAVVAIVSASLCAVVRSTALTPLGGGTRVCAS